MQCSPIILHGFVHTVQLLVASVFQHPLIRNTAVQQDESKAGEDSVLRNQLTIQS